MSHTVMERTLFRFKSSLNLRCLRIHNFLALTVAPGITILAVGPSKQGESRGDFKIQEAFIGLLFDWWRRRRTVYKCIYMYEMNMSFVLNFRISLE